jgi:hypothetical protein
MAKTCHVHTTHARRFGPEASSLRCSHAENTTTYWTYIYIPAITSCCPACIAPYVACNAVDQVGTGTSVPHMLAHRCVPFELHSEVTLINSFVIVKLSSFSRSLVGDLQKRLHTSIRMMMMIFFYRSTLDFVRSWVGMGVSVTVHCALRFW